MANTIHIAKMHGAGNDYKYVNTRIDNIPDPVKASIEWSKPHFGIGSDGLVLIGRPSESGVADFSMHIYNADGSEAMMCGNASRCIGKYLYEKGFIKNTRIKLETLSGVKVLNLHLNDENKVGSVTVDMLEPITEMPEQFTGKHPSLSSIPGADKGVFVSMGNPHYVIFVDDISDINIAEYGKILERDQAFPQRCNIEFAQLVGKDKLRTRVWERGSGITMACGTGACATATAAIILGLTDRKVDIIMDGGTLNIEWNKDDGHIYMTGPAEFVFEGEIQIP